LFPILPSHPDDPLIGPERIPLPPAPAIYPIPATRPARPAKTGLAHFGR